MDGSGRQQQQHHQGGRGGSGHHHHNNNRPSANKQRSNSDGNQQQHQQASVMPQQTNNASAASVFAGNGGGADASGDNNNPWKKHHGKQHANNNNSAAANSLTNTSIASSGGGSNNGGGRGGGRGGSGYWQRRRGGRGGGGGGAAPNQQQQGSPKKQHNGNNNGFNSSLASTNAASVSDAESVTGGPNSHYSHNGAPKRGRSTPCSGDEVHSVNSGRGGSNNGNGNGRQNRRQRREHLQNQYNQAAHNKRAYQHNAAANISTVTMSSPRPNNANSTTDSSDTDTAFVPAPIAAPANANVNTTFGSSDSTSTTDDEVIANVRTGNNMTATYITASRNNTAVVSHVHRNSTGTNTTPQSRPRAHAHKTPMVMPTPDGVSPLQDPTVFVSPYVRVVNEGEDNMTTIRTLESLLKYGTAGVGSEEDTPFLAPSAGPDLKDIEGVDISSSRYNAEAVASMLKLNGSTDIVDLHLGTDEDELTFVGNHSIGGIPSCLSSFGQPTPKPPSPGLKFSLDGVATPNTWGAIACTAALSTSGATMPDSICLPPATDPSGGGRAGLDFSSGLSINKSISTPETSMYRFLINDYDRDTDTFRYRTAAPEMKAKFMQRIGDLCAKVSAVLEQECLMCAVATPVYVLGDIHGNFCDLSYFLKAVLAFNDIHLSPCNILCLGDYVDRGPFSLECVLLLFALKATAPGKVTLLRGNHEDRVVCGDRRTYGNDCFLAQCQNIFGQQDGYNVFIKVTEVFRHLPLAAEIVISNAPNNPQAPRDLADEDDWESVPNNSISKKGDSMGGMGMQLGSSANTTPISSLTNVGTGMGVGSGSGGDSANGTPAERSPAPTHVNPPKTPKNAFRVEHTNQREVRKMFTDRNWLRRQTHVERILCTHGGIPRFSGPPRDSDSLAFLRSPNFPRLLTLFPNNPLMRDFQPQEVERFRNVPEEVMQRAWFTMFDLMWSDPTVDDSNVNEWGFGINTRGTTVVSFSAKAVETFLDAYKYSMLFRAHQEKAHGIRLSKSKKVLTIFSTSNYLGHGNGAGCAVVSPYGEIQLIVKTSE